MCTLNFSWDKSGSLRAETEHKNEQELAWFFEDDVQASVWACRNILSHVDAVASGRESEWLSTGNAHTLTLTPRGATLENVYVEPKLTYNLPLAEFRRLVYECLTFVEAESSKQASA